MDELLSHLVSPFLTHPDKCENNIIESKAAVLVELKLHDEDKESFTNEQKFSVQHILSLATGNKKPVLNVVDEFTVASEDSSESESSDSDSSTDEEVVESTNTETDETTAEESGNNEE